MLSITPTHLSGSERLVERLQDQAVLHENETTPTKRRRLRQRGRAELVAGDPMSLEEVDLVSLDGVQVVVHGQEHLRKWKGLITVEHLNLNSPTPPSVVSAGVAAALCVYQPLTNG